VDDIIKLYRTKKNLDRFAHLHPNQINDQLNKAIPVKKQHQHRVEFAPLSMWLVHSQIVGHEIIYGRKMAAYTIRVEPSSLRKPKDDFVNRVRRALSKKDS
jgi:hypothetical protein